MATTDLRYALRQWRSAPGFTASALFTIALGVGANTAVFSVVDAVLLRSVPYRDPDRLVAATAFLPKQNSTVVLDSVAAAWRAGNGSFEEMAAWRSAGGVLQGAGDPVRLRLPRVSAEFLPMLGVSPVLGSGFQRGEENAILLTHALWRSRFGADAAIVGRMVALDEVPHRVAGVLPAGFEFPSNMPVDGLLPMAELPPAIQGRRATIVVEVIGRLKRGVAPEAAENDLALVTARATEGFPPGYKRMHESATARVVPLVRHLAGDTRQVLWVFAAAVGVLLLIACANVANMLLAKTASRMREVSLRLAIGAGRSRIGRQLLTESLALAAGGSALGVVLATAALAALRASAPASVPAVQGATLNLPVMLFTVGITAVSGLLFGLAPMFSVRDARPSDALRGMSQSSGTRFASRIDGALVAAEIALAVMLLTGAGLLGRTFLNLMNLDPGFDTRQLLTARVQLPPGAYQSPEQQRVFHEGFLERVQSLPGVRSAGAAAVLPYGGFMMTAGVEVEGRAAEDLGANASAAVDMATPDYFRTLGIPLIAGRAFDARDVPGAPPVGIVNQAFVARFFPSQDPMGERVRVGPEWVQIVGVVSDIRQRGLASKPEPHMHRPFAQSPGSILAFAIRTAGDPLDLVAPLRAAARSIDSTVLVDSVATMDQTRERLVAAQKFNMRVLGVFAMTGLLLAATGVYGVLSYSVSRRKHEIGVRMALGARQVDVMALVLGRAFRMTAAGAVVGVAGALAVTRGLSTLLFGVTPDDPVALGIALGLVALVAGLAAYLPSRRAAAVNPRDSLQAG